MSTMSPDRRTRIIKEVCDKHDALDAAFTPIIDAFKTHDFPAFEESWRVFDAYIEAVAILIGDSSDWLKWHVYDNECGRRGFKAKGSTGDFRHINTAADLARLIESEITASGKAKPIPKK